jgi:hypothetical protein
VIGGGYNPWFVDELIRRIDTDRRDKASDLGNGIAPDFGAYQYACGVIEGLRLGAEHAEDIKREQDRQ